MATIEKMIFDCLSAGYGVNISGIGSLTLDREPAKVVSETEIAPPMRKIFFSEHENPAFDSVVDLIAANDKVDSEIATQRYEEWLNEIRIEDGSVLAIKEVGIIKDGSFFVSERLFDRLNPSSEQRSTPPAVVCGSKRRISWLTLVIIILSLLVIGAIAYLFIMHRDIAQNFLSGKSGAKIENVSVTENGTLAIDSIPKNFAANEEIVTPSADHAVIGANPATQKGMYYLVVGVFSIESNADKLIKSDPLYLGSRTAYQKHAFKGGKTMVSAFRSTNREEVEKKRRDWAWIDSEIWVYGE